MTFMYHIPLLRASSKVEGSELVRSCVQDTAYGAHIYAPHPDPVHGGDWMGIPVGVTWHVSAVTAV